MSQNPPELLLRAGRSSVEPWAQRNAFHAVVNRLGGSVINPGDSMTETMLRDNAFFLTFGDHLGLHWNKPGSRLVAGAGARMTRLAIFDSDADVSNLEFSSVGNSNNDDYLVSIGAEGNVTFTNCRFRRDPSGDPTFINIESGGKARFVGCYFGPVMDTVGNLIDNPGAVGSVMVIAHNETGNALGNVTSVAVTI